MTKMKFSGNSKTENVVKLCLKIIKYHFSSPDGIPNHFGSFEIFQAGSYGKLKRLVKFFRLYGKKVKIWSKSLGLGKIVKCFKFWKFFSGWFPRSHRFQKCNKNWKTKQGVDWEDLFENQTITYRHVPSRTVTYRSDLRKSRTVETPCIIYRGIF